MTMKKQNVRCLSLIVCTFTYLLIGAAVFDALEAKTEQDIQADLQNCKDHLRRTYNVTELDLKEMMTIIWKKKPYKAGRQWKFAGAFYFSLVVVAMIGYGHSTPQTTGGQAFCMVYALVGIPINMVMFQSVGERLNALMTFILTRLKRKLKFKRTEVADIELISVGGLMSITTVIAGSAVVSYYENWSYFDTIYYSFITFTTIGFGDYVALQQKNYLQERPEYVAFVICYILLGLAILASSLNLLVLRLVALNEDDERREELQAQAAAREAVRVEGDVITAKSRLALMATEEKPETLDQLSVCSCTCLDAFHNRRKDRFKVRRSATSTISHLLHWRTSPGRLEEAPFPPAPSECRMSKRSSV